MPKSTTTSIIPSTLYCVGYEMYGDETTTATATVTVTTTIITTATTQEVSTVYWLLTAG